MIQGFEIMGIISRFIKRGGNAKMTALDVAQLKVLVVDDHLLARKMTERILSNLGFKHVDQASDVQEAMDKLNAAHYDIIFLDWHMPGSSGYYFLQTCRSDRKYDNVAFVIVSAEAGPRFISEAMKAGATSYVVKPFTEAVLRESIDKTVAWLSQRSAAAEKSL